MKTKSTKVLQQTALFILLFLYATFVAEAQYTLTDDDVVVTDGVIQSCSYDFSVKNIIIPETLDGQTVVGIKDQEYSNGGVFYNKGITSVVLPASLTSIGGWAFTSNSVTSLDLSACTALASIGSGAFYKNSLTNLDLSTCTALISIGASAFNENQIANLELSACTSLKFIGSNAFPNNLSLTEFKLPTPNYTGFQHWIDNNNVTFSPGSTISDFKTFYRAFIPYTLTDIDVVVTDGVIQSCSYDFSLTDIIIPTNLDGQTVIGIKDS